MKKQIEPILRQCGEIAEVIDRLKLELAENPPLLNQAKLHEANLQACRAYLENKSHTVAFVGSVGVGKTTAICRLLGLVDDEGVALLSTASGRTTLCEVEIRHGDRNTIRVEPLDEAEVQNLLLDFTVMIEQRHNRSGELEGDQSILSSEFERCLRNMLGFTVKREMAEDNTVRRTDLAVELMKELGGREPFLDEALKRLRLSERTICELSPEKEAEPGPWLKKTFGDINHGRRLDTPIPKRIVVEIAREVLEGAEEEIRVIDTKGLDSNVEREDIDAQLGDERTVSVICSRFNDAPEQACQALFTHMLEIGLGSQLSEETILLILDRGDEASQVMAEDGPVGTREDGRMIRQEQVEDSLRAKLRLSTESLPPIAFLNASDDDPAEIHKTLLDQISALRLRRIEQITEIAEAVEELVSNREAAQAKAAFETVSHAIRAWAGTGREAIAKIKDIYKPLVDEITTKEVYAASIRAAVNRRGEWQNFDFYYKLALASRKRAVSSFQDAVAEIISVLENQAKQESLAPAHPFIRLLLTTIRKRVERIHERATELTRSSFEPPLKGDGGFWTNQQGEWGQGPGYKVRIAEGTEHWFHQNNPAPKEKMIQEELAMSWAAMINEVEALLAKRT